MLYERRNLRVVVASDQRSKEVQALVEACGYPFACDWSRIYPYWLVAEKRGLVEGDTVGCIYVVPGLPFGRVDFLSVDPGLRKSVRRWVVWGLIQSAMASLKAQGAPMFHCLLNDDSIMRWEWDALLERSGLVELDRGHIYQGVLADLAHLEGE